MSLYEEWTNYTKTVENYETFWDEYLAKEKTVYEDILQDTDTVITGTVAELAQKYRMENKVFVGFMEGIKTSLMDEIDVEEFTEESTVELKIDFEKLYYNMHAAKADWLYDLPEWEGVIDEERRKEITKEYKRSNTVVNEGVAGRNDPCPCGSGKKHKKCCGK